MPDVAGFIRRTSMLYKTGVEYGDYTMNHVQGCAHGCMYPCYAFLMKKRFGQVRSYEDWLRPYLVENTLDLLDEELPRLRRRINSVHLCFSTDPFMYDYPQVCEMSLRAISRINRDGIKCSVLTKGVLPIELGDHNVFSDQNDYGITLVSLSDEFSRRMEPHAASIENRLQALENLHRRGCNTWVSIEPYPTPNIIEQDLNRLLDSVAFVDKIIFGRTNYSTVVSAYADRRVFYNNCAELVQDYCNRHGIDCHIKKGTITA